MTRSKQIMLISAACLVALGGYAALEFLLEFLRADNALVLGPLTFNQLVCVAWLAIALLLRGATAAPVKGVVSTSGP
mgnify:CR=1 FL=1